MSESQPVFMRLSPEAVMQLDRLTRERGASKREVVTRLLLGDELTVGRHEFRPTEGPAVLTAREAAELLRVDEALVVQLAQARRLPSRRLGEDWRFSRDALLRWLRAPDDAPEST